MQVRRLNGLCAAIMVVGLSASAMVVASAAAPAWSIVASKNPTAGQGSLSAVSCPTATDCFAVGYANHAGIQVTLAERWNGTSWTIQPTPNPVNASSSGLLGVSCTAIDNCIAVGEWNTNSTTIVALVERWNGTAWAIQHAAIPAKSTLSVLSGVSCTTATACTAVGDFARGGAYLSLAERWNGTTWAIQHTPNPAGATYSFLGGVACPTATDCTAVGNSTSTTSVTLAEHWDGTSWTLQPTSAPTGAQSSGFNSVACPDTTGCTAVGYYTDSTGTNLTLAEQRSGTSWVIQATPNPPGYSTLASLSCASATACIAVGSYSTSTGTQLSLAESWDGTSWTIQSTPNPAGARSTLLSGVSCVTAAACIAVGSHSGGGSTVSLAEQWNGTSWAIQSTPNPAGTLNSVLAGISCTSAAACTAVGDYNNSLGTVVTLVEAWNGTQWLLQQSRNPVGARSSMLSGVSCAAATSCTAVGSYEDSSFNQLSLAESWNGTSWTIQSAPSPSGYSVLSAVSCTAAGACTAVGTSGTSPAVTLAERWDGTSWTVQTTPTPAGASTSALTGVSCTGASACTAIGHYNDNSNNQVTLAESWDGTSWTIQSTPNVSGATFNSLVGLSCTAVTACTAVGSYGGPSSGTLAERWDGTAWTIQSTPNPSGSNSSELSSVSCASATSCIAVGSYPPNNCCTTTTLAEQWDGTSWTIQATPNPHGAQNSVLSGVACTSTTTCMAAGSYAPTGAYNRLTLVERYS